MSHSRRTTHSDRSAVTRQQVAACARAFIAARAAWSSKRVPDPRNRRGRSAVPRGRVRNLRHGHQENSSRIRASAADPRPRAGGDGRRRSGAGVTKFKPGDRVVSFHHIPCGDCFYCEKKLFSQCAGYKKTGLTAGFDPNGGGFAQYVRAMPWIVERGMIALPADVSFEEATFVEPVNTCLKAVRKARVAAGETVLVIGQGPIGMLLVMLAKLEGATVYTSDPMAGRRAASVRFGAKEAFDPASVNLLRGNSRAHRAAAARTRCCWPCRTRHWCRKRWRSRGRAGACYCSRTTIRCCSLSFRRRPWGSRKRKFWEATARRWTIRRNRPRWFSSGGCRCAR